MATQTTLKSKCPFCGKRAETLSLLKFGNDTLARLKCGHTVQTAHLTDTTLDFENELLSFKSKGKGYTLYPYQVDGVRMYQSGGMRVLNGDQMGLGKTVQTLAALDINRDEVLPVLWITKGSLVYQAMHEAIEWMGVEHLMSEELIPGSNLKFGVPYIIDSSKTPLTKGFKFYIVPYNVVYRFGVAQWEELGIKTVVIDECQALINSDSKRTQAVRLLCSKVHNVIAMSGTPIKNKVTEYYNILNILRPDRFSTNTGFYIKHIDFYEDPRSGARVINGLKDPEAFKAETEDFIFRREVKDVAPDLPEIRRAYHHVDIFAEGNQKLAQAYQKVEEEFEEFYNAAALEGRDHGMKYHADLLGYYSRMRHITSLAKLGTCIDFLTDFLLSYENGEKIVVFAHHKDATELLHKNIADWCRMGGYAAPLLYHAGLSAAERNAVAHQFKTTGARIMVASTLAASEGLNMEFCGHCVFHERQWNPANEEQGERRFIRNSPDRLDISHIMSTYMIAVGTIDEWITELVEAKRRQINEAMRGEKVDWDESGLASELARYIIEKRKGQRWQRK